MRTNTHTAAAVDRLAELRAEKARIDALVKAQEAHIKAWALEAWVANQEAVFEGTEHTVKVVHSTRKTVAWKTVAEEVAEVFEMEADEFGSFVTPNTSESDVVSLRITGKAKQAA